MVLVHVDKTQPSKIGNSCVSDKVTDTDELYFSHKNNYIYTNETDDFLFAVDPDWRNRSGPDRYGHVPPAGDADSA
ncbi:hypothetical protein D9M68_606780 [compost metagenome]